MHISKIKIQNFKCFNEVFTLELSEGLNIIVGCNESGKSTILEAIHLTLSGLYSGRYLKNELSEYLFNNKALEEYKSRLSTSDPLPPPEIFIEVFLAGDDLPLFEGDGNSEKRKECGVCLKIALDENHRDNYAEYIKEGSSAIPRILRSDMDDVRSSAYNAQKNTYKVGIDRLI